MISFIGFFKILRSIPVKHQGFFYKEFSSFYAKYRKLCIGNSVEDVLGDLSGRIRFIILFHTLEYVSFQVFIAEAFLSSFI